jgi:hypothetical protein
MGKGGKGRKKKNKKLKKELEAMRNMSQPAHSRSNDMLSGLGRSELFSRDPQLRLLRDISEPVLRRLLQLAENPGTAEPTPKDVTWMDRIWAMAKEYGPTLLDLVPQLVKLLPVFL